jgi:hypothetical protein
MSHSLLAGGGNGLGVLTTDGLLLQDTANSEVRVKHLRDVITGYLGSAGLIGASDFLVSAQVAPDMSVEVSYGAAYVLGPDGLTGHLVVLDAPVRADIPPSASNVTYKVVLTVYDPAGWGLNFAARVDVITGTPAVNQLALASVTVLGGFTSVVSGNLSDLRVSATPALATGGWRRRRGSRGQRGRAYRRGYPLR